ncbi:hypothetical protein G9A89_011654 [Geosiphon pyriformis]|nr:hypothetical protein G9A89_011654 [Geosiphon pyriformis]
MGAKKELTIAQRNTICLLQQHGKKYRDIANIVNCSLTTVSDTIKRFKETGSIDSRPRSGRQRLFTHQKYRRLKRLVTLNGKI